MCSTNECSNIWNVCFAKWLCLNLKSYVKHFYIQGNCTTLECKIFSLIHVSHWENEHIKLLILDKSFCVKIMHCSFLNLSETVNFWGDVFGTACLQNDLKWIEHFALPEACSLCANTFICTYLKARVWMNGGPDYVYGVCWLPVIRTEIGKGDLHS